MFFFNIIHLPQVERLIFARAFINLNVPDKNERFILHHFLILFTNL